jgi:rSAM/selenodomain-associated transferase 1
VDVAAPATGVGGLVTGDALVVFVKAPRPGVTKTRLAARIGAAAAAAVSRALAGEAVKRTAPRPGEYERLFFYAPADAGTEMQGWLAGQTCRPQAEGDLGARMSAAFDEAFRLGAGRVALVGTDVPGLSAAVVREALAALRENDLALGPARDGGYYLMALGRPCPGLFTAIPWSTPSVLAATVERAGVLGLSVRLLDPMRDVDTLEDLRAEWPRIAPLLDAATRGGIEAALAGG